jgi:hypothetical protein|tara:strand:+ start:821 stop:1069 length:249 start_codon:yes stop_codon:yes gene_type:complete
MKNFRVQIRYHGYYADFTITAEDSIESIENSILDKLGKNEVKFDTDGFTSKTRKWITYEEVKHDSRPIQTQEVLGVRLGARV